jgi:glycyl-tRNA synthetase
MAQVLNFQQVIMKLHSFWADQGCLIWNPYNIQVGAGTGNPATLLRVLGPEPWRVAYVEPSVRPDDGRYGENPNRMQYYFQYQVILKPDPGNPQEIYLKSLEAIGINLREHDIRFVEDNWQSPALGAWGLGWEVWLDGQEITQFTYFQQAGGMELEPVSVEITYGLERITLALQDKNAVWDMEWIPGLSYGDVLLQSEKEYCKYYFEIADVEGLKQVYDEYEIESKNALEAGAVIPAYDYVLKCSHLFNVLDARGAIGVTERAYFFHRMRGMTRDVVQAFAKQREELGYPLIQTQKGWDAPPLQKAAPISPNSKRTKAKPADFLLEIGVEELPADDVATAQEQLEDLALDLFERLRLAPAQGIQVFSTPRRLVLVAWQVPARQPDQEKLEKGPPAARAFDSEGKPTQAALGFARGKGLHVEDLKVQEIEGGQYVTALVKTVGRPAAEVLAEELPTLIASLKFGKTMRWNSTRIAFSRPLRWILALFGNTVIPFDYAGVASNKFTRLLRGTQGAKVNKSVRQMEAYMELMQSAGIILSPETRRELIRTQINQLVESIGGRVLDDPALLDEVTNLVEKPTAFLGKFEENYLTLPREVLVMVMAKKQRYFAVEDSEGKLLPYFVAVRNGDSEHMDNVTHGNEQVLRARFADASFFYAEDTKKNLSAYLPRLATLTFQEKLGSMLDKSERIVNLVEPLGKLLNIGMIDIGIAQRAATVLKADLATHMVVEMTDLQGIMGREYARLEGYPPEVADAIFEHWLPRSASDRLPANPAGMLLALTDRLDSLVGLFAVGLAPKATADPYGLRRAALGVVQILAHQRLDIDLNAALEEVMRAQPVRVAAQTKTEVLEFIGGRLRAWVEEQDWPRDVIAAVLAEQGANPARALEGLQQLTEWIKRPNWEQVLDGFARCVRITRGEPERYGVNPDLLQESFEKHLYTSYVEAWSRLNPTDNVGAFLDAFEPMLPAITDFFNHVMVNVEEETIRHNRLGLLQAISAMQKGRADLSLMTGF